MEKENQIEKFHLLSLVWFQVGNFDEKELPTRVAHNVKREIICIS